MLREPLELHTFWKRIGISPLPLLLGLFLALSAVRAYGYFGADTFLGLPIMASFLAMWLLPFLFLTAHGRYQIGMGRKLSGKWFLIALLAGGGCAFLCYAIGLLLYGKSDHNWFVSVAYTYQSDERLAELPRHIAFIAFTVPAMLASPIGEELFFRGMIEQSGRDRLRPFSAALLSGSLFAAVHLVHHGIYRYDDTIHVQPISGLLWFLLMLGTSLVFSYLRQKGESIWTATVAHSAFNLVMNVSIFYSLMVITPSTLPPA